MDIAKRDMNHLKKLKLCEDKYTGLFKKYNSLKKKQKENIHYRGVIKQYKEYISGIRDKQTEQYDALQNLTHYIDEIHRTTKLSEQLLDESKKDQRDILTRMKKIKDKNSAF